MASAARPQSPEFQRLVQKATAPITPRITNENVSSILAREAQTDVYRDRTADKEGVAPDPEDVIAVPCPSIVVRYQFERVVAMRAMRNPKSMAAPVATGTTLLTGIACCGMPGCQSGVTIRT